MQPMAGPLLLFGSGGPHTLAYKAAIATQRADAASAAQLSAGRLALMS